MPRLLTAACLAVACSAAATPSTQPSITVHLDAAVPLDQYQGDNVDVNLTDKLSPPQTVRELYFGEIDRYPDEDADEPSDAVPVLAVRDGDAWKALPLMGAGLTNAGWKFVGSGPGPREIWGALDTSVGDTRWNFVLAHSTDAGATFTLSPIRKPCRQMTFFDFTMDRRGAGRATLSLDADCGRHHPGLYHYTTHDDGRTWSASPTFEPDDINRADTVPDDEQPAAPQAPGGARTATPAPEDPNGAKAVKYARQGHLRCPITARSYTVAESAGRRHE